MIVKDCRKNIIARYAVYIIPGYLLIKKINTSIVLSCLLCLLMSLPVSAQEKLYPNEFPLADVKLLEGPFKHARDLNIKVLLQYDADRLLAGYRKEAGLPAKAKSYPNWDGLDGHVGGHYLSALAINFAATHNPECGKRLAYMIDELKKCQDANTTNNPDWGIGYAGAVPGSKKVWSSLQKGDLSAYREAWVPWYNVHKIYAGLRDAWMYTGNTVAREIFLKFCDWGIAITAALTDTQMQAMLDTEHGGMNEIFADACQMTGDKKYLTAAKRFSHRVLLDAMAAGNDNLDNKHANTQVPKAIGFERIGELANDENYKQAGDFFWETVTTNRTLAFGGNSRREFFPGKNAAMDFIRDVEGPESCNSYNMLKLTEDLFRENPLAKYADYYERTVYNHILSTQHPVHGGYVYFTPVRPEHYRVYSSPNQAMWCCVGSGMENHGKYGQFIYTHIKDTLYVNLFMASELNWRDKKIKIKQQTVFPYEENTSLVVTEGASAFTLMIRYPSWVSEASLKIEVNGSAVSYTSHPSSYIAVKRFWKKGDVVNIRLPMHNSIEPMPNLPDYIAFMHGPVLLGARTGTEDLKGLVADDGRWSHIASGKKIPLVKAPVIIEDTPALLTACLKPVPGKPLNFTATGVKIINRGNILFEPFFQIHDSRYMMYWMTLSNKSYQSYLDSIGLIEKKQLALDKRTIDFVAPGEQQPEADHLIQKENSTTGNSMDAFWRDARNNGYFSYQLATGNQTNLTLLVKYWGAEWGNRQFDIYIDGTKLVSENNTGRWNQSKFQDIEYRIPDTVVKGKEKIRLMFKALPNNTAGAVYHIRLLRKEQ